MAERMVQKGNSSSDDSRLQFSYNVSPPGEAEEIMNAVLSGLVKTEPGKAACNKTTEHTSYSPSPQEWMDLSGSCCSQQVESQYQVYNCPPTCIYPPNAYTPPQLHTSSLCCPLQPSYSHYLSHLPSSTIPAQQRPLPPQRIIMSQQRPRSSQSTISPPRRSHPPQRTITSQQRPLPPQSAISSQQRSLSSQSVISSQQRSLSSQSTITPLQRSLSSQSTLASQQPSQSIIPSTVLQLQDDDFDKISDATLDKTLEDLGLIDPETVNSTTTVASSSSPSSSSSTSSSSLPTCPSLPLHHLPNKDSQGQPRLFKFIVNLLESSKTNPSLIEWVDRSRGMFALVNPNEIARRWGVCKNNSCMNYEKMSRGFRYYYKVGILERVPGRRLVYKFSARAPVWNVLSQTTNERQSVPGCSSGIP